MIAGAAIREGVGGFRMGALLGGRLPVHAERLGWDPERLTHHQRDRLRELLAYAVERSPFHARRLGGIDPRRFELADLPHLPVMSKAEMMDAFDDFVTDGRLDRQMVEDHLAASAVEPRPPLLDEYVCLASGGSSGVRGIFVQTLDAYADFGASVLRRGWARLVGAGGPPPDGVVLGMVAAKSPIHSTGLAAAVIHDGPFRFVGAPATEPVARVVELLNEAQPAMLMGYPGRLAELARAYAAGRLRISPRSLSSTSEPLTAEFRGAIEEGFAMPVIDQFASTEGLVGGSDPGGSVLTFATDMCIAELVDADHQPVRPGETSAKVLVTNLHNFTQPLIRYELADRFTLEPESEQGFLRARVEGRADDVLRFGSVVVHPHVIRSPLVGAAVREHQVRQTPRGVEVAVVAEGGVDEPALAASLETALSAAGVRDPRAAVRAVERIAPDPETGKTKRFIPLRGGSRPAETSRAAA